MANFVSLGVVGTTDSIHDEALNTVGTEYIDEFGRTWVYMKGVANTIEGSWVTYDEGGVTALLAADAIGPVAVAGAAIVAGKYGFYCVCARSGVTARLAASSGDNAKIGREGADGVAGDGRAAGDEIYNCVSRTATSDAAAGTVQFSYPFVDNANGA